MIKIPELLCPAGSMTGLKAALHFGADAVYGAMKRYGLRSFAANFDEDELETAVRLTHAAGKKFYLTLNALPYDDDMDGFITAARTAAEIGTDAAIVSDLGAIVTLRKQVPHLPVHVSTQANTLNTASARHYADLGCTRVILAREMSLDRIRRISQDLDGKIELESFVHGASCVAYSGRCLLSSVLTGRSGNQGACAQPCRWKYAVVEEKRPGEYMPVTEDENGTYIFSAHDLCLMPLLAELCSVGLASIKIEGRMKTEYYVAVVTGAYRRALDMLAQGEENFRQALPGLTEELACASHRASDMGFLQGPPEVPGGAEGFYQTREYIARVEIGAQAGQETVFELKNRFFAGDRLELMTARGVIPVEAVPFIREKTGEVLSTFGTGGERIRMRLPVETRSGDMLRGPVRNHRTD